MRRSACAPPLGPLHARRQRAGAREGQGPPRRRPDPRPRGRRRPRRQGRGPRPGLRRRAVRRVRQPGGHHPGQRPRHRSGTPTTWRPSPPPAPTPSWCPRSTRSTTCGPSRRRSRQRGAPDHTKIWAMVETPVAMLHAEEIAGCSERLAVLVMGTNDLAKELRAAARPRPPAAAHRPRPVPAGRPRHRQGHPRRRLQRHQGRRGVPGRVPPGPRDGLRRQDADPPSQLEPCNEVFAPIARGGRATPRRSSPPSRPPSARARAWSP